MSKEILDLEKALFDQEQVAEFDKKEHEKAEKEKAKNKGKEKTKLEEDRDYVQSIFPNMQKEFAKSKKVPFRASRAYAQFFGERYSFLFNGVAIAVEFNDSEYMFPDFVVELLENKIRETMLALTPDREEKVLEG